MSSSSPFPSSPRPWKKILTLVVALALFAGFGAMTVATVQDAVKEITQTRVSSDGEVYRIGENRGDDGWEFYVRFTDVTGRPQSLMEVGRRHPGDEVEVLYDPERPVETARTAAERGSRLSALGFVPFSLLFAFLAGWVLYGMTRDEWDRHERDSRKRFRWTTRRPGTHRPPGRHEREDRSEG